MKKWMIPVLALLLCAGCADKSAAEAGRKPAGTEAAAEEAQTEEAEKEEPAEDESAEDAPEETGETEISEDAAAPEKSFGAAKQARDVENNGGNFVRVGNRVYFRNYCEGGLPETALFGKFLGIAEEHPASVWYYDEETGKAEHAFDDNGCGPLWYGEGGFYLTAVRDEQTESFFYPEDGGKAEELGRGIVRGVSEEGQYAAFWSAEGHGGPDTLSVLKGTESAASAVPEGVNYTEFCGMAGPETVWLCHGDDGDSVWELDGQTGELLCLGLVPSAVEYSWAEMEQFVPDGDDFYLMLAWYEGTGHFLADYACLKGTFGQEDSLALEDVPFNPDRADVENPPKILLTGPGEVMPVERTGREVELTDYDSGDLIWCDSPFSAVKLIPGFISKAPYDGGDRIIQAAEIAGDAAYLIVAYVEPAPEEDIGWRTAYRSKGVEYLRVPLLDDSTAEHLLP